MSQKFRVKQVRIKSELADRSGLVTENMTSATPDKEVGTTFKNVLVDENGEFVVGPESSGGSICNLDQVTQPQADTLTLEDLRVTVCGTGDVNIDGKTVSLDMVSGLLNPVTAPVMGGAGTTTVANITTTGADLVGTFVSDGGATVTATGFVLYPSGNPSTVIGGVGVLQFIDAGLTSPVTVSATGLISGTNYCSKPYVTNSVGTSYGDEICFSTLASIWINLGSSVYSGIAFSNNIGFEDDMIYNGYMYHPISNGGIGGGGNRGTVDVNTLSVTSLGALPGIGYGASYTRLGDYIYKLGGYVSPSNSVGFFRFNLLTGIWSNLSNYPIPIASSMVFTDGIDIYSLGGTVGPFTGSAITNNLYKYSILSNSWTLINSTYPTPGGDMSTMIGGYYDIINNILYCFGGQDTNGNQSKNLITYNFNTSVWSTISTTYPYSPVINAKLTKIGDHIYIITSNNVARFNILSSTWSTGTSNNIGQTDAFFDGTRYLFLGTSIYQYHLLVDTFI